MPNDNIEYGESGKRVRRGKLYYLLPMLSAAIFSLLQKLKLFSENGIY
jgi:hypothetical protein